MSKWTNEDGEYFHLSTSTVYLRVEKLEFEDPDNLFNWCLTGTVKTPDLDWQDIGEFYFTNMNDAFAAGEKFLNKDTPEKKDCFCLIFGRNHAFDCSNREK